MREIYRAEKDGQTMAVHVDGSVTRNGKPAGNILNLDGEASEAHTRATVAVLRPRLAERGWVEG